MTYDSDSVRAYFDTFGEREWERLETTLQGRTNFAVHRRFLHEYVRAGMRVLDIGSGPGRFAIEAATLGAEVTLVDLSHVQLESARKRLSERGLLDRVRGFHQSDILDLRAIDNDAYDAAVCFGGVLSYTKERHPAALREIKRVVRPGGNVLVSVMSLLGILRLLGPLDAAEVLEAVDSHLDWHATLSGAGVVYTRVGSVEFHQPLALFTSAGLRTAITDAGFTLQAMASANPILPQFQRVPKIEASERAAELLQKLEVTMCDSPGLLDAGGHLLAVARRPDVARQSSVR
jgi:2-polyprenyl-3-methyl-5-hydroxy-6-metoxy-1,4-benzoquinol methylase